jgi:hypothetical protein
MSCSDLWVYPGFTTQTRNLNQPFMGRSFGYTGDLLHYGTNNLMYWFVAMGFGVPCFQIQRSQLEVKRQITWVAHDSNTV